MAKPGGGGGLKGSDQCPFFLPKLISVTYFIRWNFISDIYQNPTTVCISIMSEGFLEAIN